MDNRFKTTELCNGSKLPVFGLGTYKVVSKEEMVTFLRTALDLGYRHIDTAIMYENEKQIGDALQEIYKEGKYKREDLFLVTKLFSNKNTKVEDQVRQSLQNLQTNYIDLYLLHYASSPPTDQFELTHKPVFQVWAEFEELVQKGLIRNIGISNFNVQMLLDLYSYCKIKPVVNQIEVNVYCQQPRLLEFCKKLNLHVTAYCPLARCQNTDNDALLTELSTKYKKSVCQIMLQFLLSLGVSVIPKTQNLERLRENIESTDFSLDEADIAKLKGLNKNFRLIDPYDREWWKRVPYFD
ncbi:aldo/keto reductase family oxidoreductase (macronuclear) [Tetrahymena thermophila SB210]|uniref:Aldo/keto reductase family oxidoreductase n=1 Tax=Tetrahymena thermophila (strain SB210) TaxID=312017 RepID=I7M7Q0_TETTS|nr:aldo/keto reductase family oxidoreductase [Tetrahymena thermophila SB210]EAR95623.1 aldo/keto reductase family oxidoreductase [Tetrahymena thermophila SB210]|eukprot:XP_001015868.1 aldo/keto reductase family oxidoreductase [Tetrahymena thermophila SB210]